MDKINVLGIGFDNITLDEATDFTINKIKGRERIYVVTPNAEITHMCLEDNELLNIVTNADLVLPDGSGVVLASKILNTPIKQKVAGIEYAENLVKKMALEGMRLYILGGKPNVAKRACENLSVRYRGLEIAGYQDGYFDDEAKVIEDINKSDTDVLFVCLGVPKQEHFMSRNLNKLNLRVMCGIGGAADVFAGEVNRAPKIFIKLGLEWFYRLLKQPSRIGRMKRLPLFLIEVLKYKKRGKNGR